MRPSVLTALLIACAPAGDDDTRCGGGKCDSGSTWKAQLDGRKDLIAAWLRDAPIDDLGRLETDYGRVVREIAVRAGCGEESIRTFIVSDALLESESFPRLVSTVCSDDVARAADFFIAASFREDQSFDVDARRIEMFAWDPDALRYHFYEASPDEAPARREQVKVEIEPARCRDCHLAPRGLPGERMPMTPIMNELTRPWVHWSAEPDARSFEYQVPEPTRKAPHFRAYGEDRLASAARLEKIIAAAHGKVASARIRERRTAPATVEASLAMLRPLFCEEQLSFATEDFDSGVISATVAIPGGLREGFVAASASGWPWHWLTDGHLRLPAATGARLVMMPVRGNADIETEKALLASGTLTPQQVLRVRALDWKNPLFSGFRCDLWKQARLRLANQPPRLDPAWRNADAMRFLYDEILQLDGVPLRPQADPQVIAVDVADAARLATLRAALRGGALPPSCAGGVCAVDLMAFGDLIDAHVKAVEAAGRAPLLAARSARLCRVIADFENRPGLPEVACP